MKTLATLALAGVMAAATPAFANDYDNTSTDKNASMRENIREDNQDIARHRAHRAEARQKKAAAKARGEYGEQAKQSAVIGGEDVAIGKNKAERYVERSMMDDRSYHGDTARYDRGYDYDRYSPSSGDRMERQGGNYDRRGYEQSGSERSNRADRTDRNTSNGKWDYSYPVDMSVNHR